MREVVCVREREIVCVRERDNLAKYMFCNRRPYKISRYKMVQKKAKAIT